MTRIKRCIVILTFLVVASTSHGFCPISIGPARDSYVGSRFLAVRHFGMREAKHGSDLEVNAISSEGSSSTKSSSKEHKGNDMNPITKASWYAVEAFGKIFATKESNNVRAAAAEWTLDKPPTTLQETIGRIRVDNEREYFLSGKVDDLIYDEQCTFADPFVSFQGRTRFVENLANLGSFITEYRARPLSYQVSEDNLIVKTKFMVKLRLNLPWKPVLAWPWGVKCVIDPDSKLIVLHEESWDIEPWEGIKQIFRKPTVSVK